MKDPRLRRCWKRCTCSGILAAAQRECAHAEADEGHAAWLGNFRQLNIVEAELRLVDEHVVIVRVDAAAALEQAGANVQAERKLIDHLHYLHDPFCMYCKRDNLKQIVAMAETQ